MTSLRNRLWLGFGSLLLILLVVSALSMIVFTRYSRTLERVFSENYNGAIYCDAMKESLDQLNTRASVCSGKAPPPSLPISPAPKPASKKIFTPRSAIAPSPANSPQPSASPISGTTTAHITINSTPHRAAEPRSTKMISFRATATSNRSHSTSPT